MSQEYWYGRLNLNQFTVFHRVARHLSFSRAGEELGLSQPAVSRQVASLERTLGLNLLVRGRRGVSLTEAGRRLWEFADRILDLVDEAVRTMAEYADPNRGEIVVGAESTASGFVLPAILRAFRDRHPEMEVHVLSAGSREIEEKTARGELDLGVTGLAPLRTGLYAEPYVDDELVLVVAPEHPLATASDAGPDELKGQTVFHRQKGTANHELTADYLTCHRVTEVRLVEVCGLETLKGMVAAGLGVAFLSRRTAALELAAGILAAAPSKALAIPRQLFILAAKERRLSSASLALLNLVRKALGGSQR